MKRPARHHTHVPLTASVRTRLTLWYLAVMAFIIIVFGGSLYATETFLNADVAASRLETQLYQDSQHFESLYKQALLHHQPLKTLQLDPSAQEMILLLGPDGNVLDSRGPLTSSLIQQLQASVGQNSQLIDLNVPQNQNTSHNWGGWWDGSNTYRVLIAPVLNQNARVATLMVGLPLQHTPSLWAIWCFLGTLALLIAACGGFWLAGKALQPVKMITRTAREINATDLRRRLHFKRRDEFGELAATFDQMLARLEAAFKRQAQFTADASHELRTPLTIIDLEINRALTQLERPEEYRQALEQIQVESAQMAAIVNNLLLLARADTGQMKLDLQEVDLSDIALACVERLLPLALSSGVTLATGDLPEALVYGDPHYLGQMLTNLIENGIKYTSGIGKRVYVELACEQNRWGVVRVQDDGPGISDEYLPSLFDRFYRVDKARSRRQQETTPGKKPDHEEEPDGSGLGLSIVQWIVQAHGGEIRVESSIGAGSLFEVRLPLLIKAEERGSSTNNRG
jgi:signal transduction histidine kinase